MKKILFILSFIFSFTLLQAQVKTIEGQLVYSGTTLTKASFFVKGRNISGKTDKNGYFILKNVTDNDVIVVKKDGRNFKVSDVTTSVLSVMPEPVVPFGINSRIDTAGVKFISQDIRSIYFHGSLENIASINKVQDVYKIYNIGDQGYRPGYGINFNTGIEASRVGRLPELQSAYAPGQNGNWAGADQGEVFSWGPPVGSLEYSGQPYDYDKNGSIVPAGMGNGTPVNTYDAEDFFRTGISYANNLDVKFPFFARGSSVVNFGQKRTNSPIPNAYKDLYNASFRINDIKTGKFTTNAGVFYKNSYEKLMQNGSNLSSILYSVFTTPATFDNANGLSRKDAAKENESWLLADGSERSYAPGIVNNPYMLTDQLPDRNKNDYLITYANTRFSYWYLTGGASFSFDKQWDKTYDGIMSYPVGHYTERKENTNNIIAEADLLIKPNSYFSVPLSYGFKRTTDEVYRIDNDAVRENYITDKELARNAHDLKYTARFAYDNIIYVNIDNKHYFSNTLSSSDYTNLFPGMSVKLRIPEFIYEVSNWYTYWNCDLTLFGSMQKSIGESPLVYHNSSVLSTGTKAEDFRTYYEYADIFHYDGLKAETYLKRELSLSYSSHSGLSATVNYFNNTTENFILPVLDNKTSDNLLQNVGEIRNSGYYIALEYAPYFYSSPVSFNIRLNFSQTWNKVTKVYNDYTVIPLAGFSNIATVFAEDEVFGAIYGTSYQRDEQGRMVIGVDGFPQVDKQLKKIGDPTPDFVMSFSPNIKWKSWELSVTMEYSHGGDRWNGTRAYLDYLGMSEDSANDRNITGYVYDGVTRSGAANTVAVNFYNPENSLFENKWVRYGATGVGEEYIEDASYFRLSDIALAYTFKLKNAYSPIGNIRVGISAQNLLLVTSYKGVDPSSVLFGYAQGNGLDLFNQPSMRTYSLNLSFVF